eukprot:3025062-Pyramimonas_sp.AAC.1
MRASPVVSCCSAKTNAGQDNTDASSKELAHCPPLLLRPGIIKLSAQLPLYPHDFHCYSNYPHGFPRTRMADDPYGCFCIRLDFLASSKKQLGRNELSQRTGGYSRGEKGRRSVGPTMVEQMGRLSE